MNELKVFEFLTEDMFVVRVIAHDEMEARRIARGDQDPYKKA